VSRCFGDGDPLYAAYHDDEWGVPVTDERGLYERLSLEAFQSGLSWLTILRKREAFRAAFAGFEPDAVARFGDDDVARLLADAGIVRNPSRGPPRSRLPTCLRTSPKRALWRRRSSDRAFASSGLRPCTPRCRPAAWSTTTSRRARAASASNGSRQPSRTGLSGRFFPANQP
jgi:DNA-3-methyladenine glycosylase I